MLRESEIKNAMTYLVKAVMICRESSKSNVPKFKLLGDMVARTIRDFSTFGENAQSLRVLVCDPLLQQLLLAMHQVQICDLFMFIKHTVRGVWIKAHQAGWDCSLEPLASFWTGVLVYCHGHIWPASAILRRRLESDHGQLYAGNGTIACNKKVMEVVSRFHNQYILLPHTYSFVICRSI